VLELVCLKGRLTNEHEIHDNAGTPEIDLIGMAGMAHAHTVHDNLRGDVIGRATDGMFPITLELNFGGKPKISEFQLHLAVDEKIAQLDTG
jgi:hypothetical protein